MSTPPFSPHPSIPPIGTRERYGAPCLAVDGTGIPLAPKLPRHVSSIPYGKQAWSPYPPDHLATLCMRAAFVLNSGTMNAGRQSWAEYGIDPKEVPQLQAEGQTRQGAKVHTPLRR